jgi:hypothetical protein
VLTLMDCVRERNDRESWTTVHELIAQAVDAIHVMRLEAFVMAGVPRYKLPDPPRVPRPGDKAEETPVVSPREFARLSVVR